LTTAACISLGVLGALGGLKIGFGSSPGKFIQALVPQRWPLAELKWKLLATFNLEEWVNFAALDLIQLEIGDSQFEYTELSPLGGQTSRTRTIPPSPTTKFPC